MKKRLFAVFFICAILLVGLVSAGLLDSIKNALTGKATSQPTNVSVNVVGTSAVNVSVDNSTLTGGVTPIESSSSVVVTYVTVCDPDGVNDVNDSATDVVFNGPSAETRNGNCSLVGDIDAYCANFTCSAEMWYWDAAGAWVINASGSDLGNATNIYNDSYNFTYNQLKALTISPDWLNWTALTPGGSNVGADNDPTEVNNTGNYDGTIDITGYDLYGVTVTSENFDVANFTADETDGACGAGTALVNASVQTIAGTDSNPGNLSLGGGAGQEQVYYCIPTVPSVSSQQYTTDISGSWIVAY